MKTNEVGLVSLGCPKNLVDGEVMLGYAQQAGHEITADAQGRRRHRGEHLRVHRQRQAGVDRRHPRDGAAQARRQARSSSPAASAERYRDELKKEIPEIDALPRAPARCASIVDALTPLPIADSRYPMSDVSKSLNSEVRPLTFHRNRSSAIGHRTSDIGSDGAPRVQRRRTSTARRHPASSPRRSTSPTSRSPKAATTRARSASSRRCAASIAAARARRSSPKRGRWRRAASRSCSSSRRTRRSTGSTARSAARWRSSCAS